MPYGLTASRTGTVMGVSTLLPLGSWFDGFVGIVGGFWPMTSNNELGVEAAVGARVVGALASFACPSIMFPPVAAATGIGRSTSPPAAPAARAPANRRSSRRLVGFRLPFD